MASTSPRRGASGGPNGYAYSNGLTTSNRASWAESQGNPASVMDGHVIPPRYPHIKDLQAKAQADESVSINSSVRFPKLLSNMALLRARISICFSYFL